MDFLAGIVDHHTNCVQEMSRKQQAYCLQSYLECDSEFMSDMLLELAAPPFGLPAEAAASEFCRLIGNAIQASTLLASKTDADRAEAYRALGEMLTTHAKAHAKDKLDAYIEDNLDSLADATDETKVAMAYGE